MKTFKTICILAAIALTFSCGYSSGNMSATVPAISELAPNDIPAGGNDFTLTVDGSNFATGAVVNWNGNPQSGTSYISGSQLTVTIPAALITTSAQVQVTVTNPATTGRYGGGTPVTSRPMMFTIQ
jgi:hypothetical protein